MTVRAAGTSSAGAPARGGAGAVSPPGSDAADDAESAHARAFAAERLGVTRRVLRLIAVARVALWAAAALAAGALALAAAERAGRAVPFAVVLSGVGAVAAAAIAAVARPWRAWTLGAVALWVEARVPALRYALVTLAESGPGAAVLPTPVARVLAERVRASRWDEPVRAAAWRALARPTAGLAGAGLLLAAARLLPAPRPSTGATGERAGVARQAASAGALADPLAHVRATVTPPAYARQGARVLDDPGAVSALAGSAVVLEGNGEPGRVRASLVSADRDTVVGSPTGSAPRTSGAAPPTARTLGTTTAGGGRWRVALAMPGGPAALRLAGPTRDRVIVLDPRPDLPPRVALLAPTRDTVVRLARGIVTLRARADDDLGLADGAFEYVVSSGEGENFTFRSGRIGAAAFAGARNGALGAALDLGALALKPGDLVHVRALARDARPGAAPGASDTRAIRVARAGEYDSVAVEGAPPPDADTSAFGQRMLLQLTEALVARAEARRAPLARPAVVDESRRIGGDQARLRRRVGDAVFSRLGGSPSGEESQGSGDASERRGKLSPQELLAEAGRATGAGAGGALEGDEAETPVTAVNRPLLEAYNAMWDAGRALEVGEPRRALAPMRRAIAALERARQAERIYLRGRPAAVVVDLAKVRGLGRVRGDTLRPAPRGASAGEGGASAASLYAPLDPAARARAAGLDRALATLPRAPRAAADSLALLRVNALGAAPALAAALGEALDALARGADATLPLARARRAALGPAERAAHGAGGWAPGWRDLP